MSRSISVISKVYRTNVSFTLYNGRVFKLAMRILRPHDNRVFPNDGRGYFWVVVFSEVRFRNDMLEADFEQ